MQRRDFTRLGAPFLVLIALFAVYATLRAGLQDGTHVIAPLNSPLNPIVARLRVSDINESPRVINTARNGELLTYTIDISSTETPRFATIRMEPPPGTQVQVSSLSASTGKPYLENFGAPTIVEWSGRVGSSMPASIQFSSLIGQPNGIITAFASFKYTYRDDPDWATSNLVTTTILPQPDLRVSLLHRDGGVAPGERVYFTINYANIGEADAMHTTVSFTLPAPFAFDGPPGRWNDAGGGVYTAALGTVAAHAAGSLFVVGQMPNVTAYTGFTATVRIAEDGSTGGDANLVNNLAVDAAGIYPPSLQLRLSPSLSPVLSGQPFTVTLVATNASSYTVEGSSVRLTLPQGASYLPGTSMPSALLGAGELVWPIGALVPGQSVTLTVQVVPHSGLDVRSMFLTASVAAENAQPPVVTQLIVPKKIYRTYFPIVHLPRRYYFPIIESR